MPAGDKQDQACGAAGRRIDGIRDDDGVSAGVLGLNVRQRQGRGRRAGDRHSAFAPLVRQRSLTAGRDGERGRAAAGNGHIARLPDDRGLVCGGVRAEKGESAASVTADVLVRSALASVAGMLGRSKRK